jgi:hypothetical protein
MTRLSQGRDQKDGKDSKDEELPLMSLESLPSFCCFPGKMGRGRFELPTR